LELVVAAFDHMTEGMRNAAGAATGLEALTRMGAQYNEMLNDRAALLLQLQGFAACGDPRFATLCRQLRPDVAGGSAGYRVDSVTIKAFLAFGMLLNNAAASRSLNWTCRGRKGRTRIRPGSSTTSPPTRSMTFIAKAAPIELVQFAGRRDGDVARVVRVHHLPARTCVVRRGRVRGLDAA